MTQIGHDFHDKIITYQEDQEDLPSIKIIRAGISGSYGIWGL